MSDVSPELVAQFQQLFRGRETVHGQFYDLPEGKRVKTLGEPASPAHWVEHLAGRGPYLGIVPITVDNVCYFAAIDVDDDDVRHDLLESAVERARLPLVVCRSKSGGAHLYAFFREPVPAATVVKTLRRWQTTLELTKNRDGRDVEIFPKQTRTKPKDHGNWINLPYYRAHDTVRYAVRGGQKLTLAEFITYARSRSVTAADLEELGANNGPFGKGPPCLQTLHQIGLGKGGRNSGLFNMAVFYKMAKPDAWQDELRSYNRDHVAPPLPDDEVEIIIGSVENGTYAYTCNSPPIVNYCNKVECRKQPFGIGVFSEREAEAAMPAITGLIRIQTDPVLWRITVGETPMEIETPDLLSATKFRLLVLERIGTLLPNIKQGTWEKKLKELHETHTTEAVPEEAGVRGQFHLFVNDFLLIRLSSQSEDDILRGRPYPNGGRVYFRAQDLIAFLERRRFFSYDVSRIYSLLSARGLQTHRLRIKGARVGVWSLPEPQDDQTESFTTLTGKTEF